MGVELTNLLMNKGNFLKDCSSRVLSYGWEFELEITSKNKFALFMDIL